MGGGNILIYKYMHSVLSSALLFRPATCSIIKGCAIKKYGTAFMVVSFGVSLSLFSEEIVYFVLGVVYSIVGCV